MVEITLDDMKVAIDYDAVQDRWGCSICGKRTKYGSAMVAHVTMHHTGMAEIAAYFATLDATRKEKPKRIGK